VHFSRKRQDGFAPIFFQSLGENTCSLQPALKTNALGLQNRIYPYILHKVTIAVSCLQKSLNYCSAQFVLSISFT